MKPDTWSTYTALGLLVACVLGCGNSTSTTTSTSTPTTATATPTTSSAANHTGDASSGIAGNYDVTGTNPNGSAYKGTLEVIKHGDAYQFRWNAGKQYDGVGVENAGVVAVASAEGTEGRGCGVVTYKVLPDGTLDGKWAYWGLNQAGTEKAARATGSGIDGTYNTTGTNPGGSVYKGKLTITAAASGHKFVWDNGSTGFGIKQSDTLSIGIGGARCAFVAYEIKPNGMLDGIFGGYGSEKTGTEKAVKKN